MLSSKLLDVIMEEKLVGVSLEEIDRETGEISEVTIRFSHYDGIVFMSDYDDSTLLAIDTDLHQLFIQHFNNNLVRYEIIINDAIGYFMKQGYKIVMQTYDDLKEVARQDELNHENASHGITEDTNDDDMSLYDLTDDEIEALLK